MNEEKVSWKYIVFLVAFILVLGIVGHIDYVDGL